MKNFLKFTSSTRRNSFIVLLLALTILAIGWIATPTAYVQEVTGSNVVAITEDAAQAEMKRQLISVRGGTAQVSEPATQLAPNVANAIRVLPGCTTNTLPANDDGSTAAIPLPFNINFFGVTRTSTFVNNNGNITFAAPLGTFTPFPLTSTNTPIIAPFFADVDTRGPGSGLTQYGNTTVNGRTAFCVNWVNVGYFASRTDKLNSFQLLLIERFDTGAGNFDIEFNYNQILWETGDASGGTMGLGGSSARAGYANGTMAAGTFFELPGSAVNGGLLDSNLATGLTNNSLNSGVIGRYIFTARNGGIIVPTPTPTPAASPTPSPTPAGTPTPTPTPGGNVCTPSTIVTEGDLFPGGIPSFGVSSGPGSVTIDHVNAGTGTQSITLVGVPVNAVVTIPPFVPGTFNPVVVTFTTPSPGLAVDFTLRAASTFHAIFIRVRCAETCTPTAVVTEGDLFPGGIPSFAVMTGPGSVTVDHVNLGTGLRSLTLVGAPVNAVVNIPAFVPGTFAPVVVTFTPINPALPVSFRLRAASLFHAIFIDVRCGTVTPTPTPTPVASPTPTPVASPTPTPVASPTPTPVASPTPGIQQIAYSTTLAFPGGVTENRLISYSLSAPGTILSDVPVGGLNTAISEYMSSIDFRPATGVLYGLIVQNNTAAGASGTIRLVTVDRATGNTTPVGVPITVVNPGNFSGFDFNPVPDRIRVVRVIPGGRDENFRLNPNDGTLTADTPLAFAAGDPNVGLDEFITAAAYTNSFAGATTTTLYDIDTTRDLLVRQGGNPGNGTPGDPGNPNSGQLFTIGALGVNTSGLTGFDITSDNRAFAVLDTSLGTGGFGGSGNLYTINLGTGAATLVGRVGGLTTRFTSSFSIAPAGATP